MAGQVLGSVLLAGGLVMSVSAAAFATTGGSLTVSPNTGLIKGVVVRVSGSGLAHSSKGYLIECNMAPHEPTVLLGSPVFNTLDVGCSPPSLRSIYSTSSTGTLSGTFQILLGRKRVGPPCGLNIAIAGCPQADNAGKRPGADAQNYPCPPTPAQQVAGDTCQILYVDAAGNLVDAPIYFAGGGPGLPGSGGGGSGGGGPGGGKTTTTVARVTTTTAHTTVTTSRIVTAATTNTTAAPTKVASGQLAYTGPGPSVHRLLVVGIGFTLAGALVWLSFLRMPSWPRRRSRTSR